MHGQQSDDLCVRRDLLAGLSDCRWVVLCSDIKDPGNWGGCWEWWKESGRVRRDLVCVVEGDRMHRDSRALQTTLAFWWLHCKQWRPLPSSSYSETTSMLTFLPKRWSFSIAPSRICRDILRCAHFCGGSRFSPLRPRRWLNQDILPSLVSRQTHAKTNANQSDRQWFTLTWFWMISWLLIRSGQHCAREHCAF